MHICQASPEGALSQPRPPLSRPFLKSHLKTIGWPNCPNVTYARVNVKEEGLELRLLIVAVASIGGWSGCGACYMLHAALFLALYALGLTVPPAAPIRSHIKASQASVSAGRGKNKNKKIFI